MFFSFVLNFGQMVIDFTYYFCLFFASRINYLLLITYHYFVCVCVCAYCIND